MGRAQINNFSGKAMMALAAIALFTVLSGYLQAPQPDEGAATHIFQLSVAAQFPALLVFAATAEWTPDWRIARPLVITGVILLLAFAALYYLEHFFYVEQYW